MSRTTTRYRFIAVIATVLLITGCTVSYKFNGASIDYSKTKTITIRSFTNNAPLVYPALAPMFNESLRDVYAKQTRLTQVSNNGDIELEGEITGYDITPMSIGDDAIASETRLTITINVRYTNKADSSKDFERNFSAFQNYSNTQTLTQVQEELCQTIVDEIVETIFNQTVADW
ncbi:MAG: LptE family protein [Paludibacteraceae bacterium]|nr:LptE family protein [Paludibacteraceae bacterium]MBP5136815.1 LptE family protein [Paludibacteraceae bacterium]